METFQGEFKEGDRFGKVTSTDDDGIMNNLTYEENGNRSYKKSDDTNAFYRDGRPHTALAANW